MDTDDHLIKRWSAFNCLYCEGDHKGHSYVLNAGKWYLLDKDFVKRVNDSFEKMPRYSGTFMEYDDETETIYNERLVTESGGKYHVLDRDLTHRGGKMEFCDVFWLCTKSRFRAATPPDVRRRLCLAVTALLVLGLRPSFGLWPKKSLGHGPNQGHSPISSFIERRGIAPPHIRRRSRSSQANSFLCKATSSRNQRN